MDPFKSTITKDNELNNNAVKAWIKWSKVIHRLQNPSADTRPNIWPAQTQDCLYWYIFEFVKRIRINGSSIATSIMESTPSRKIRGQWYLAKVGLIHNYQMELFSMNHWTEPYDHWNQTSSPVIESIGCGISNKSPRRFLMGFFI